MVALPFSPRLAFRVWQREATLYRKLWASTILSNLFDPFIYLVAMGYGLGAYLTEGFEGVSYLQWIAPGLVASSVMMAAAYEVAWNAYVRIHIERTYEAMMTTPAALEDVVVGEIAWATTRAVIYAAVMLVVLLALGLVRSPWALLVPAIAALGGATFAVLGLTYTVLVKHMEQLTFYFTLVVTPMFLFSGVFFPLDELPAFAQVVAQFSPLYHLVEVVRALVLGTVHAGLFVHTAVLAGVVVALGFLPVRLLRRKLLI
ncbi:MAG TPA: ABC transporter permease [Candidatus Thermoplasmatota archaeon]|nr:ABC transporter permease [Candidatus Thermoplasmatota archaeon]